MPNTPEAVRRLLGQLGSAESLQVCDEASPTGYGLYRQLTAVGMACTVVAPALIPRRPGDRVKTDRRDALRLAELFRAGELAGVWVPTAESEALRDLVRARDDAVAHRLRARHHLSKFRLRRDLHTASTSRPKLAASVASIECAFPCERWKPPVGYAGFTHSSTWSSLASLDKELGICQLEPSTGDVAFRCTPRGRLHHRDITSPSLGQSSK